MNSMEFNKIVAAVLTAGVVAMLLGLFAKLVIPEQSAHGDHHGPNLFADLAPAAPVESEGPTIEPIAPFLAAASVEDGMKIGLLCRGGCCEDQPQRFVFGVSVTHEGSPHPV